jgi:hypothetical protein
MTNNSRQAIVKNWARAVESSHNKTEMPARMQRRKSVILDEKSDSKSRRESQSKSDTMEQSIIFLYLRTFPSTSSSGDSTLRTEHSY